MPQRFIPSFHGRTMVIVFSSSVSRPRQHLFLVPLNVNWLVRSASEGRTDST